MLNKIQCITRYYQTILSYYLNCILLYDITLCDSLCSHTFVSLRVYSDNNTPTDRKKRICSIHTFWLISYLSLLTCLYLLIYRLSMIFSWGREQFQSCHFNGRIIYHALRLEGLARRFNQVQVRVTRFIEGRRATSFRTSNRVASML